MGGQVVTGDLVAVLCVENADVGVADVAETLLPVFGMIDAHREDDPGDAVGQPVKPDVDLFVIPGIASSVALRRAGEVVTPVDDLMPRAREVVEVDEEVPRCRPAVRGQRDGTGVQVELGGAGEIRVPAQADRDVGEPGSLRKQGNTSATTPLDVHSFLTFQRRPPSPC